MTEFPKPQDGARLHAVLELEILNAPPEVAFDQLTLLASMLTESPIAMIGFYNKDMVWYKSRLGFNGYQENPSPVLTEALHSTSVLDDVAADPRIASHPMVQELGIHSMLLVPLFSPEGLNIGYLAVADLKKRAFSEIAKHGLELLAAQVEQLLQLRVAVVQQEAGKHLKEDSVSLMIAIAEGNVDAMLITDTSRRCH